MRGSRRALLLGGRLALIALLLVPLLLREHGHHDHVASSAPCAVCVATGHASATVTTPVVAATPAVRAVALRALPLAAPALIARPSHAVRGPPAPPAVDPA
jgi:hypothetical protein